MSSQLKKGLITLPLAALKAKLTKKLGKHIFISYLLFIFYSLI